MSSLCRIGNMNVPGHGLKVVGGMEIKSSDLSGETSATAQVSKGIKAKTLRVSCTVAFRDRDKLQQLIRLSEQKASGGDLAVHTIVNRTAEVSGIRQVQFAQSVGWSEMDTLKAWTVSFTLREYHSVPEKKEQREKPKAVKKQTSEGVAVTTEGAGPEAAPEEEMGIIESAFSYLDDLLAPDTE
ncbi:MAG: hypothetical protein ACNI27_11210 [Desulfovibrio sp.]